MNHIDDLSLVMECNPREVVALFNSGDDVTNDWLDRCLSEIGVLVKHSEYLDEELGDATSYLYRFMEG